MDEQSNEVIAFQVRTEFANELNAASSLDFDISCCYGCARCSSVCRAAIFGHSGDGITPRSLLYKTIIGDSTELISSPFIWLCSGCGRCQDICPQKVLIPEIIRALRRLSIESGHRNPYAARVNERTCMHCGACVEICPNDAITLVPGGPRGMVASVDVTECRGCGSCTAVCSNSAIRQSVVTDMEVLELFTRE